MDVYPPGGEDVDLPAGRVFIFGNDLVTLEGVFNPYQSHEVITEIHKLITKKLQPRTEHPRHPPHLHPPPGSSATYPGLFQK